MSFSLAAHDHLACRLHSQFVIGKAEVRYAPSKPDSRMTFLEWRTPMYSFDRSLFLVVLSLSAAGLGTAGAAAADWRLNKQPKSNTCHVQIKSDSPQLGNKVGEYDARKAACQAASSMYDPGSSNQEKCWGYGRGTKTSCKSEGIELPGSATANKK